MKNTIDAPVCPWCDIHMVRLKCLSCKATCFPDIGKDGIGRWHFVSHEYRAMLRQPPAPASSAEQGS